LEGGGGLWFFCAAVFYSAYFVWFHTTPTAHLLDAAAWLNIERRNKKTASRIIHTQCDCVWHCVKYLLFCVCVWIWFNILLNNMFFCEMRFSKKSWRKFCCKFPRNKVLRTRDICKLTKKVRSGSLLNKKSVIKHTVLSKERLHKIGARLEHTPQRSEMPCKRDWHLKIVYPNLIPKDNFNLLKLCSECVNVQYNFSTFYKSKLILLLLYHTWLALEKPCSVWHWVVQLCLAGQE
jgi:hypothetical protein